MLWIVFFTFYGEVILKFSSLLINFMLLKIFPSFQGLNTYFSLVILSRTYKNLILRE